MKGFLLTLLAATVIGVTLFFVISTEKPVVAGKIVDEKTLYPPEKLHIVFQVKLTEVCAGDKIWCGASPRDTVWLTYSGDTLYIRLDSTKGAMRIYVGDNEWGGGIKLKTK